MNKTGIYFTSSLHTVIDKYPDLFGLMLSLADTSNGRGIFRKSWLDWGRPWIFDNGVFVDRFTPDSWFSMVERLVEYRATCKGIVIPDMVGDKDETLVRWKQFAPFVINKGFPTMFVSQDGITPKEIPWNEMTALFVGGTDDHKLRQSWPLIVEAKRRNLWVHVGRVNSKSRLLQFWMVDSWDGTTLGFEPSLRNQSKIANAVKQARTMKSGRRLL